MPVQSNPLRFPNSRPSVPRGPISRPPARTWALNPTELAPRSSVITLGTKLLSRLLGAGNLLALLFTPSDLGADDEFPAQYRKLLAHQAPVPRGAKPPAVSNPLRPAYSNAARRKAVADRIKYLFNQGRFGPISIPHGVIADASLFAASGLDALLTEDHPFPGGKLVFQSHLRRPSEVAIVGNPSRSVRRLLGLEEMPTVDTPPLRAPDPVKPPVAPPVVPKPPVRHVKPPTISTPPVAPPKSGTPVKPAEPPAVPGEEPVSEPGPAKPEQPSPAPDWTEVPETIPYHREGRWPEIVLEGSFVEGQPALRVRARSRADRPPTREADHKPRRRSGIWALHHFITSVWGEVSDVLEIWELLQANLYTELGTRLDAIRGPLDPAAVMQAWLDGELQLDEMGFLRDFAVNQFEDAVIARMSAQVTRGELSVIGGGEYGLTVNQRLNQLNRTIHQINGGTF